MQVQKHSRISGFWSRSAALPTCAFGRGWHTHARMIYPIILGLVLLAAGCGSSSDHTCVDAGTRWSDTLNTCVCDNAAGFWGNPGNCQRCSEENTVIVNNECVCDEANKYARDSSSGLCSLCNGVGEIFDSNGYCRCDIDNGYYNTASNYYERISCAKCDNGREILNGTQCVCPGDTCDDCNGGCFPCDYTYKYLCEGNTLKCNTQNGYYGNAENCFYCNSDVVSMISGKCVCNDKKGFIELGTSGDGDEVRCGCDASKGFIEKAQESQQCTCDTEKGFIEKQENGAIRCECDLDRGFLQTENGCCDTENGYEVKSGECVCDGTKDRVIKRDGKCEVCDGAYLLSEFIETTEEGQSEMVYEYCLKVGIDLADKAFFGKYFQSNTTSKEPISWRVISIEKDYHRALLLSEKVLDASVYTSDDDTNQDYIFTWLNDVFYNAAFDDNQKKKVIDVTLISSSQFNELSDILQKPATTAYAYSQGACKDWDEENGCSSAWWLYGGYVTEGGRSWNSFDEVKVKGVRPAIWIKLPGYY